MVPLAPQLFLLLTQGIIQHLPICYSLRTIRRPPRCRSLALCYGVQSLEMEEGAEYKTCRPQLDVQEAPQLDVQDADRCGSHTILHQIVVNV